MADNDNIVEISEFVIQRRRRDSWAVHTKQVCAHLRVTVDEHGQIVECKDCGKQVSAFWYLTALTEAWERIEREQSARRARLDEDLKAGLTLQAARRVEEAWRRRKMLPTCPHCERGIAPQDGFGQSMINRAIEQRVRLQKPNPGSRIRPLKEPGNG